MAPNRISMRWFRVWLRMCAWMITVITFAVLFISQIEHRFEHEQGGARRNHDRYEFQPPVSLGKNREEAIWPNMLSRQNRMLQICDESEMQPMQWALHEDQFLRNLYLDLKNNLVYCNVLKGGSTFWKRMLGITSGVRSEKSPYDIPAIAPHEKYLSNLNDQDTSRIEPILSSSLKFTFTRDPYSRLFSCYIDKVFTPRSFYRPLRDSILLVTRKGWDGFVKGKACPLNVSFREFFQFVIFSVERNVGVDEHFTPMFQACRPCEVRYDFIGKMETFLQDVKFILYRKGLDRFSNLTRRQADLDAISDMVDSAFFERGKAEECLPFSKVLEIVWRKAIIRGILSKHETFPGHFRTKYSVTKTEFRTAMLTAYKRPDSDFSRHQNRKSAMIEAFSTISAKELRKYQQLFFLDFQIFGYDVSRPDILESKPDDTFSFLSSMQ